MRDSLILRGAEGTPAYTTDRPVFGVGADGLIVPLRALGPVGTGPELTPLTSRMLLGAEGMTDCCPGVPFIALDTILGVIRFPGELGTTDGEELGARGLVDRMPGKSLPAIDVCEREWAGPEDTTAAE